MTEDRVDGAMKEGLGHVQDAVGGLIGSGRTQLKGKLNEAAGSVQGAVGQVKERAQDVFGQASDRAQDVFSDVRGYARQQPMNTLAIGVGIGLAVGLLLWGGRRVGDLRR